MESETPESETRFEPEVRRSPKESDTPESATRDQPRSQSLLPIEPESHRSSNPPDTVGNAERPKSRVFRRLQAQRGLLRQKVVFQPTGLRDLKGVLSLTEDHRAVRKANSTSGERRNLGTHSCYSGEARRDGQGEGMITPLGNGVRQLLVIMPSTAPFRKRKDSVDTESAQHARTLCHTPLHRHCAQ